LPGQDLVPALKGAHRLGEDSKHDVQEPLDYPAGRGIDRPWDDQGARDAHQRPHHEHQPGHEADPRTDHMSIQTVRGVSRAWFVAWLSVFVWAAAAPLLDLAARCGLQRTAHG
jgi:hypothetical protein